MVLGNLTKIEGIYRNEQRPGCAAERGLSTAYQKWEETIVHPETEKDVIVIPFTFEANFPEKDIIRGYLMDMNLGKFSN